MKKGQGLYGKIPKWAVWSYCISGRKDGTDLIRHQWAELRTCNAELRQYSRFMRERNRNLKKPPGNS